METLTLQQSTIRGVALGKTIFCTLRGSPPGLKLAAGSYLLRPAQNNPVYGLVMAIEPFTGGTEAWSYSYGKMTDPASHKVGDPAAVKYADPAAVKYRDPAAIKYTDPAAIKYRDPAAMKYADPAAIKFGAAAAVATLLPPHAPAIKFDTGAGQMTQPVVISERGIAGNSYQATAGFGDLVEAVQRAGAVKLVVV